MCLNTYSSELRVSRKYLEEFCSMKIEILVGKIVRSKEELRDF